MLLDGKNIVAIREREIAAFRRDHLGFVFQDFNLLDTFSIQDNILLPLVLAGKRFPEMERRRAARMLSRVVLPEPDSPIMATYSPASTAKLTLDRAWTCWPPKRVV